MVLLVLLALSLLLIVALGLAVVAYVVYDAHGRHVLRSPRLTRALTGLVDRLGLDPLEDEATEGGSLREWRDARRDERRAARA